MLYATTTSHHGMLIMRVEGLEGKALVSYEDAELIFGEACEDAEPEGWIPEDYAELFE